jgi:hypothetical protein
VRRRPAAPARLGAGSGVVLAASLIVVSLMVGSPPAAAAVPASSARPVAAAGPPSFGDDSTWCDLDDPRIDESSGLAVSSRDPSRLWTHNDSGDSARLFALGAPQHDRCPTVGVVQLKGVDAFDAEDLAPGPGGTLWLADIGDNVGQRQRIVLDRITEPASVAGTTTVDAQRFRYRYPDQPHDAEALLISPSGQVVVVTKGSTSHPRIYAAPGHPAASAAPAPDGVTTLMSAGDLNAPESGGFFSAVTGGAVSPDGHTVVLRTYLDAYVYDVPGEDLVAALQAAPRRIDLPAQAQGESVAFSRDGRSLFLSSEGVDAPILQLRRDTASAGGSTVDRVVAGSGIGRGWLIAGAVGAALLVLTLVLGRRRRR